MTHLEIELHPAAIADIAEQVARQVGAREPHGYLNVKQAAAYLACGTDRIHDLVQQGRLRAARDGRRLLFRREWLEAVVS